MQGDRESKMDKTDRYSSGAVHTCTAHIMKYPKQAINQPAISFWVFLESLVEQRVAFEVITKVLHESAAANI